MAGRITKCLIAASNGEKDAKEELFRIVGDELGVMARKHIGAQQDYLDLPPAALVNEAYIRMFGNDEISWKNRRHFFWAAATVMRDVMVDEARRRKTLKRGGDKRQHSLDETIVDTQALPLEPAAKRAIDVHKAILKMREVKRRAADVVHLRFYAGQTIEDVACYLDISSASVRRDWDWAKEWLRDELGDVSMEAVARRDAMDDK
ncbi:MAG: ECF-type sigma factor [Phycisphaerae bacterium]